MSWGLLLIAIVALLIAILITLVKIYMLLAEETAHVRGIRDSLEKFVFRPQ